MMFGVRACWLKLMSAMMFGVSWLGVVSFMGDMSGVRLVVTCFGWSGEDGCRSQCGDEEGEEGGGMHSGQRLLICSWWRLRLCC